MSDQDKRLWHWPVYMLHFVDRRHQPTLPVIIDLGPGYGVVIDQTTSQNRASYRGMMRYNGEKAVLGNPSEQSWKRVDALPVSRQVLESLFRNMARVSEDQRIVGWYSDITAHDYDFWRYEDVQRIGRG
jgi:hypothetical protein